MDAKELLDILNGVSELSPVAVGLVKDLIAGLKGKSDAEILAEDAGTWALIVAQAHAAQQTVQPVGPEPVPGA